MRDEWPILGLGPDATEADIRRAYAAQLRERRPDDDAARFQALRSEYESALAAARSGVSWQPVTAAPARPLPTAVPPQPPPPVAVEEPPEAQALAVHAPDLFASAEESAAAIAEIRRHLTDGDLISACDRYDRARVTGEIDLAAEPAIELLLGRCFLQDMTLSASALAQIARRYRWDDSLSRFPLAVDVVDKYRPPPTPPARPGTQYIGQWNWGAFCLAPFWLMAHGRRVRGALLLVGGLITCLIPVIGVFIVISWAHKLGKNGNSIAVAQRDFHDDEHFVAVQTAWRNWGIAIFAVTWLCIIGWIAYIATGH